MGFKLGMNCKAYYGTAGNTANILMDNVKDVTLNLSTGEADVTTRGNNGWRATAATLKEGSVEFQMVWDTDDLGFVAIKDAWFAAGPIALMFLDDVAGSGSGLDADFVITNFSRNEPLEEAVTVDVTAKPTYSTRAPTWIDAT
jgi:hypothetical protein